MKSADANWLWQPASGTFYSCSALSEETHMFHMLSSGDLPARGDIGSMCVDAAGKPDYTSLYAARQRDQLKTLKAFKSMK